MDCPCSIVRVAISTSCHEKTSDLNPSADVNRANERRRRTFEAAAAPLPLCRATRTLTHSKQGGRERRAKAKDGLKKIRRRLDLNGQNGTAITPQQRQRQQLQHAGNGGCFSQPELEVFLRGLVLATTECGTDSVGGLLISYCELRVVNSRLLPGHMAQQLEFSLYKA